MSVDKLGWNINGPAYLYVNVELLAARALPSDKHTTVAPRAPIERFSAILARLRLTQSPEFIVIIALLIQRPIIVLTIITADST